MARWRWASASSVQRTGDDGIATLTVAAGEFLVYVSEYGFGRVRDSNLQRARIEPGRKFELELVID